MSFSCPHFDPNKDWCDRVNDRCVCGRPGCVLAQNSTFAIAPAIRLAEARGMKPAAPSAPPPPPPVERNDT